MSYGGDESMREKTKEELIIQTQNLETELQKCYDKINRLLNENRELRYKVSGQFEVDMRLLRSENERLKSDLTNRPIYRSLPGAGRKRKASDRDIEIIRSLAGQGHSLSEISKLLETETGTQLSRTTVRNLIKK